MTHDTHLPAALKAALQTNPFRKPNRYVEWHGAMLLAETVCKRCGTVLTTLGPDPRCAPRDRELKGTAVRTIIRETLVARLRTASFTTIEFEVEEPAEVFIPEEDEHQDTPAPRLGLHRTAICVGCKAALLDGVSDLAEVQQLYEADLERMAIEDALNKVPAEQTLAVLARLSSRNVLRIAG